MSVAVPQRLGTLVEPVAGLVPVSMAEANALLAELSPAWLDPAATT